MGPAAARARGCDGRDSLNTERKRVRAAANASAAVTAIALVVGGGYTCRIGRTTLHTANGVLFERGTANIRRGRGHRRPPVPRLLPVRSITGRIRGVWGRCPFTVLHILLRTAPRGGRAASRGVEPTDNHNRRSEAGCGTATTVGCCSGGARRIAGASPAVAIAAAVLGAASACVVAGTANSITICLIPSVVRTNRSNPSPSSHKKIPAIIIRPEG